MERTTLDTNCHLTYTPAGELRLPVVASRTHWGCREKMEWSAFQRNYDKLWQAREDVQAVYRAVSLTWGDAKKRLGSDERLSHDEVEAIAGAHVKIIIKASVRLARHGKRIKQCTEKALRALAIVQSMSPKGDDRVQQTLARWQQESTRYDADMSALAMRETMHLVQTGARRQVDIRRE